MVNNNLERIVKDFKILPDAVKFNIVKCLIKDATYEEILSSFLVEEIEKLRELEFVSGELEELMLRKSQKIIDVQIQLLFEEHFIDIDE